MFPTGGQKNLCLSLFWDLCAGVNTECFILKSNQMLYCCFCAWLPVCSVLNSAELLRRAPTSARYRSPVYLFWRILDCRSWTEQICSAVDLLEVNTETKVKPSALLAWRRRNAADTYPVEIASMYSLLVFCRLSTVWLWEQLIAYADLRVWLGGDLRWS